MVYHYGFAPEYCLKGITMFWLILCFFPPPPLIVESVGAEMPFPDRILEAVEVRNQLVAI